jgi:polyisoprenoid-binding protein YceI
MTPMISHLALTNSNGRKSPVHSQQLSIFSNFVLSAALICAGMFLTPSAALATKPHELQLQSNGDKGKVEFLAIGRPSLLRIKGQGAGPTAMVKISSQQATGEFVFQLAKLATGISLRDRHMKENYLHTDKFPIAKLSLTEASLPASWSITTPASQDIQFKGLLLLHGVEKPVTGTFKLLKGNEEKESIAVDAKFEIKISDFGIDLPSYSGITVADQVSVNVLIPNLVVTAHAPLRN